MRLTLTVDSALCYTGQSPTQCSITLRGLGLGAVLAIFGFSKYFRIFSKYHHIDSKSHGNISFRKSNNKKLFDLVQANTARSPTRCSITLRGVQLRAVLDNFGFSDISISRLGTVWYCVESDSAQCDTARSPAQRSITLRGVTFFTNIFAKTNFSAKTILDCLSGTQLELGSIHEKKKLLKISWHCLFKKRIINEENRLESILGVNCQSCPENSYLFLPRVSDKNVSVWFQFSKFHIKVLV